MIDRVRTIFGNRRGMRAVSEAVQAVHVLEAVEARRLLTWACDMVGPQYVVDGDTSNNADVISISISSGTLTVTVNSTDVCDSESFTVLNENSVVVSSGGGADTISVSVDDEMYSAVTVHGEGGNDSISGSDYGDDLYGDDGNDSIYGGGGQDNMYGGAGDDFFDASDGNGDYLYGGDDYDSASTDEYDIYYDVENP